MEIQVWEYEPQIELLIFKQFDDFRLFLKENGMFTTIQCLELFGVKGMLERKETDLVDPETLSVITEYVEHNWDVFEEMVEPEQEEMSYWEKEEERGIDMLEDFRQSNN